MAKFTIITEGGSKLELDTHSDDGKVLDSVVFDLDDKRYEITIVEKDL